MRRTSLCPAPFTPREAVLTASRASAGLDMTAGVNSCEEQQHLYTILQPKNVANLFAAKDTAEDINLGGGDIFWMDNPRKLPDPVDVYIYTPGLLPESSLVFISLLVI